MKRQEGTALLHNDNDVLEHMSEQLTDLLLRHTALELRVVQLEQSANNATGNTYSTPLHGSNMDFASSIVDKLKYPIAKRGALTSALAGIGFSFHTRKTFDDAYDALQLTSRGIVGPNVASDVRNAIWDILKSEQNESIANDLLKNGLATLEEVASIGKKEERKAIYGFTHGTNYQYRYPSVVKSSLDIAQCDWIKCLEAVRENITPQELDTRGFISLADFEYAAREFLNLDLKKVQKTHKDLLHREISAVVGYSGVIKPEKEQLTTNN